MPARPPTRRGRAPARPRARHHRQGAGLPSSRCAYRRPPNPSPLAGSRGVSARTVLSRRPYFANDPYRARLHPPLPTEEADPTRAATRVAPSSSMTRAARRDPPRPSRRAEPVPPVPPAEGLPVSSTWRFVHVTAHCASAPPSTIHRGRPPGVTHPFIARGPPRRETPLAKCRYDLLTCAAVHAFRPDFLSAALSAH